MRKQLNKCVKSTFNDLETAYQARDSERVRKFSDELVNLVSLTDEPEQNQVETCAYLVEKQLELGRHDRAVDLVTKMIFVARTSNDVVSLVKALVTLGKVHLRFGFVDALVRVWEKLVGDLHTVRIIIDYLFSLLCTISYTK